MKKYVIFFSTLVLFGCVSAPEPEPDYPAIQTNPIEILDLIPWEDGRLDEVNAVPLGIIKVLYHYNYKYINFTQSKLQEGDTLFVVPYSIFTRSDASYDDSDDTFLFYGRFYPPESSNEVSEGVMYRDIWLVFSQEEKYKLFMIPNNIETDKEGYAIQDNYVLKKRTIEVE
jgi:hypothetical protein